MDKTYNTTAKPFITEAGPVTRYLFSEAQADPHGLAFVRSYPDDIRAFLRNVREYDDAGPAKSTIRTYDDALASLEDDIKKFPELNLESIIEYSDNPLACQQNDDYLIVS